MPEKTPLNAKVFDPVTHEDYIIEKVCFEARPGFLVTGNLYRPVGDGPFPGVVCPHGHWEKGRLEDTERCSVPARCITFARMGIVAFSYDMIGYNDSMQFTHNWGGPKERLWGIHPFAMQLWSSIRAVDFLLSLPYMDPERIGCTGASGGGTQTFALTAVDPRIKVSAPVNMISCSMQGGCLCENAPIIRMDNSNMEAGALMAPKPMLMVAATGDWTTETPRIEYPAVRSIYALYGAQDHLETVQTVNHHNYSKESREAVYRFFGKWLLGGDKWATFTEPPYQVEPDEKLRVFPDKEAIKDYPKMMQIIASIIAADKAKWDAILPQRQEDLPAFREKYGMVLADILGTSTPAANDLALERVSIEERPDYVVEGWVIGRKTVGDAIPAILYRAYSGTPQDAVLLVHGAGKAALANLEEGGPGPLVTALLAQGKAVLCIDAFLTGEYSSPRARAERYRAGQFMETFQPTDTGYRVQDVLTSLAFLRARRDLTGRINVAGLGEGGMWCLLADAIDGQVPSTVVDFNRFDVNNDEAWVSTCYIPCIRAVGDVRTAAALYPPRALAVMNTGAALPGNWFGARVDNEALSNADIAEALK
jgi:cephalosporin-C deacetylase-like acetyl esterase